MFTTNHLGCPSNGYSAGIISDTSGKNWRAYIDRSWVVSSYTAPYFNLTSGQWAHIVATYNMTNMTIYVNGARNGTGSFPYAHSYPSTVSGFIGAHSDCTPGLPTATFKGQMDDAALWNRTLTPTEVLQLYNKGPPIDNP